MNKKFNGKEVQIYIIENDGGYIKIGVSTDVDKRFESLSGSNGGGHKIVRQWVSIKTYLYTFERMLHLHFNDNRIEGTEWFQDLDFDDVVSYAESLMNSCEFARCNQIRKEYNERIGGVHGN